MSGSPGRLSSAAPAVTYQSVDAAGNALYEAAKSKDDAALLKILGPDAAELISEGDAAADAANRAASDLTREYTGPGIRVQWYTSRCIHVGDRDMGPFPCKQ